MLNYYFISGNIFVTGTSFPTTSNVRSFKPCFAGSMAGGSAKRGRERIAQQTKAFSKENKYQ